MGKTLLTSQGSAEVRKEARTSAPISERIIDKSMSGDDFPDCYFCQKDPRPPHLHVERPAVLDQMRAG